MSGSARPMNPERGDDWATGKGGRPGVAPSDSQPATYSAATASPPWKASYFWMRGQRDHWLNVAKELVEDYERLREENERLQRELATREPNQYVMNRRAEC